MDSIKFKGGEEYPIFISAEEITAVRSEMEEKGEDETGFMKKVIHRALVASSEEEGKKFPYTIDETFRKMSGLDFMALQSEWIKSMGVTTDDLIKLREKGEEKKT